MRFFDYKPQDFVDYIESLVLKDLAKKCTYVILGRPGPTGKTWLANALKNRGYTAIEISEDVLYTVSYNDDKNHMIGDPYSGRATIILNKPCERKDTDVMKNYQQRRKGMIALRINDYCHNCQDFEAEVEKLYHKDQCETFVSCRHATKCERIKRHLEKAAHVKSPALCRTCTWSAWNDGKCASNPLDPNPARSCDGCPLQRLSGETIGCKCSSVRDGDPCPYYEKL